MKNLNLSALSAWSAVLAVSSLAASAAPARATAQQSIAPDYLKPAPARTFAIEYTGKVPEVPAGSKLLRVWLPVPQDSSVQSINYFLNPHAEADGKPVKAEKPGVSKI